MLFAKEQYDTLESKVTEELTEIVRICNDMLAEQGIRLGHRECSPCSHRTAGKKMNGTYNTKTRKYFFMDFLRGEDVLLNDNYLPETQSTFCGMPDFHILYRIEQHASKPHPELPERLSEILSNVETKHNFRTARLIKAYGGTWTLQRSGEHKDLAQYGECLKQAKQRFETMFQDFSDELELCESYGTFRTSTGKRVRSWRLPTRGTASPVSPTITASCQTAGSDPQPHFCQCRAKGERLLHQLEELADSRTMTLACSARK